MSATGKIKNKAQEVTGKAKEYFGRATGDERTENDGKADQAESHLKNAGEQVKDAFRD